MFLSHLNVVFVITCHRQKCLSPPACAVCGPQRSHIKCKKLGRKFQWNFCWMSFASLPLLTSLLGGTTMRGSTNWERRVFVSCGPHFVLCMLYLNLTLTDHLLCSQPAHLTHIHNQAQHWVSGFFSSLPVKQCGNTCTQASCGWDFAWPEGKVSGLHSAMILFSVFQNPSPFQPNSAPAEPAQSSHQDLTFSLSDSFHYSLWSIDQKKYFHTKFGTFLYYCNSSVGKKTNKK